MPAPVPYANLTNPQTLNLYAMVSDNPESFADLNGHFRLLPPSEGGGCFTPEAPACYGDDSMESSEPQAQAQQNAQGQTAQQQNQQQYNSAKTGPEDPANPGKPLFRNAAVKKASGEAFEKTINGQARSGLAEAGFAIDYKDGKILIVNKVDSVNGDGPPNELHIKIDANTIAILHTHGNSALPTPGPADPRSPVPNFVRSQRALYVTVPGTNKYIQLKP